MFDIYWIITFLALGSIVGLMAGLLGIGGGGIMVPILTTIFLLNGVPTETVVHLALGTSMASIIVTSISSLRAHHLKGAVIWSIVRKMSPGIILGAFLATFLVRQASSFYLAIFFSIFMSFIAIQMFINKTPKPNRKISKTSGLLIAGSGIGAISAMVSIGGGSLTVPYLVWHNIDIKKAIGTSAAIGLPISIAGTVGYLINGWDIHSTEAFTFGYIYLPAVVCISCASYLTAPFGVKLAHKLHVSILKKVFSLLLILLSLKMLFSVI